MTEKEPKTPDDKPETPIGAESAESPKTDSGSTPETGSAGTPEAGSVDTPGTAAVDSPDAKAADTPETEAAATPDARAADTPDTHAADTPATDAGSTAPPPKEQKGGGLGGCLTVIVLIGILGVAGYFTWPYWGESAVRVAEPYIPKIPGITLPSERDAQVADMTGRLEALEEIAESSRAQAGSLASIADLEAQRAESRRELEGLMTRISQLESALEDVRGMFGAVTPGSGDLSDARATLANLAARLDMLESVSSSATGGGSAGLELAGRLRVATERLSAESTTLKGQVADLSQRLQKVESLGAAADTPRGQALILAIDQLRSILMTSAPYAERLDTVESMADGDAAVLEQVAVLRPMADTGVPTLEALRIAFAEQAGGVVRAGMLSDEADWLDQTLDRLLSLVNFRRTADNLGGEGVGAVVARAESSLAGGDLITAVDTLRGLDGAALQSAEPWLSRAQARLDADAAATALRGHAISMLVSATKNQG